MKKTFALLAFALAAAAAGYSRNIAVLRPVPSEKVKASASSAIGSSPASNAVDGSGMRGEGHLANNLGEGMWVSRVAQAPVRYAAGTHAGPVWFLCELGDRNSPPPPNRPAARMEP